MAQASETSVVDIQEDGPEHEKMMENFLDLYEKLCAKDEMANAPSKEKLRTMMHEHIKEKNRSTTSSKEPEKEKERLGQSSIPKQDQCHPDIVNGKVDARCLKRVKQKQANEGKKTEQQIHLPYLPDCVDYSRCCQALLLNGNLFTPCLTTPAKGEMYCKPCARTKFKYGTLEDRKAVPVGKFRQPGGKKEEITYGEYLKKKKTTIEEVQERIGACLEYRLAEMVIIPEKQLGIPDLESPSPSRRGRPRKMRKPIVCGDFEESMSAAEDYTHFLVSEAMKEREKMTPREREELDKDGAAAAEDEESLEEIQEEQDDVFPPPKITLEPEDEEGRVFFEYVDGWYYYFDKSNILYRMIGEGEYMKAGIWDPVLQQPSIATSDSESDSEAETEYEEVAYNMFIYNGEKYVYNDEELIVYRLHMGDEDENGDCEPDLGDEVGTWDKDKKCPVWEVSNLTDPDAEGFRMFNYIGKKYIIDTEENRIVLDDGSDEIVYVGTWNTEEKMPEFYKEYIP